MLFSKVLYLLGSTAVMGVTSMMFHVSHLSIIGESKMGKLKSGQD